MLLVFPCKWERNSTKGEFFFDIILYIKLKEITLRLLLLKRSCRSMLLCSSLRNANRVPQVLILRTYETTR